MTDEQKLAAVEKRRATRIARGTKGPKAKLAIKGTGEEPRRGGSGEGEAG